MYDITNDYCGLQLLSFRIICYAAIMSIVTHPRPRFPYLWTADDRSTRCKESQGGFSRMMPGKGLGPGEHSWRGASITVLFYSLYSSRAEVDTAWGRAGRKDAVATLVIFFIFLASQFWLSICLPFLGTEVLWKPQSPRRQGGTQPLLPQHSLSLWRPTLVADLVISCSSARKPYAPNSLHLRPFGDVPLPWQPHS